LYDYFLSLLPKQQLQKQQQRHFLKKSKHPFYCCCWFWYYWYLLIGYLDWYFYCSGFFEFTICFVISYVGEY